MDLIADILMVAGTFGAAVYCYVLAARLKKFSTLESGMGGAIAVLSAQVDDMTKALDKARGAATGSAATLEALTGRAEMAAARLEVMLATLHDLPDTRADARRDVEPDRRLRFMRRRSAREDLEAAE
ncbi:hypothetical protein KM031_08985 [Gemmobacter fulvus]|uniref:Uncharacterized protein n=1 Tax=Gemmobacter fulvus TaxID=2840474 RepID=A0A975P455_9RHOB|nr:hypothetical protein [Gemmobacter fulvus]MBT9246889.1 hypothetical protein [Gemmobacter fulvus]QWK89022.1 hypothetical protein KM031_08985 [Gemmobacter fulvus]